MEGYLDKRSLDSRWKAFRRRFCLVKKDVLLYFHRQGDPTPISSIPLLSIKGLAIKPDKPNYFVLETPTKRIELKAPSPADRDRWLHELLVWVIPHNPEDSVAIPMTHALAIAGLCDMLLAKEPHKKKFLLRVSGSVAETAALLCQLYTTGPAVLASETWDVFSAGSALKRIVRSLPEPLLTHRLAAGFDHAGDAATLQMLVELMPQTNAFLLKRIISLCKVLCENEESSGMNIESVAICVGPNLSESLSCYDKFFEVLIKNFDNVFRNIKSNFFDPVVVVTEEGITYEDWIEFAPKAIKLLQQPYSTTTSDPAKPSTHRKLSSTWFRASCPKMPLSQDDGGSSTSPSKKGFCMTPRKTSCPHEDKESSKLTRMHSVDGVSADSSHDYSKSETSDPREVLKRQLSARNMALDKIREQVLRSCSNLLNLAKECESEPGITKECIQKKIGEIAVELHNILERSDQGSESE